MDLFFIHSSQLAQFGHPAFGPGHCNNNGTTTKKRNSRKKSLSIGCCQKHQALVHAVPSTPTTVVTPITPTASVTSADEHRQKNKKPKQQQQRDDDEIGSITHSESDVVSAVSASNSNKESRNDKHDVAAVPAVAATATEEEDISQDHHHRCYYNSDSCPASPTSSSHQPQQEQQQNKAQSKSQSQSKQQQQQQQQRRHASSTNDNRNKNVGDGHDGFIADLYEEDIVSYKTMDMDLAKELVEKTNIRVNHSVDKSTFLQKHIDVMDKIPTFTISTSTSNESTPFDEIIDVDDVDKDDDNNTELVRGELLGTGGFAYAFEVTVKDPTKLSNKKHSEKQYVIKQLSPKLLDTTNENVSPTNKSFSKLHKKFFLGTKDAVVESRMLAALDHPHILKLQGISKYGLDSFLHLQRTDAYFMVLPKLTCTLSDKIYVWKQKRHQQLLSYKTATTTTSHNSKSSSMNWVVRTIENRRRKREEKELQQHQDDVLFCEKIQIIIDLLKALEYLHEQRIMHRDIKPPNIGFDQDGVLKLFDFGLAKELPELSDVYTGECKADLQRHISNGPVGMGTGNFNHINPYLLLGNTGTPRYMAPEIIRREPYNCKVDVYATSILCWEIMTLKKPYGTDVTGQFVKECVAIYGDRPSPVPCKWPRTLKSVIRLGWTKNVNHRLTSREMRIAMEEILEEQQHKLGLSVDV